MKQIRKGVAALVAIAISGSLTAYDPFYPDPYTLLPGPEAFGYPNGYLGIEDYSRYGIPGYDSLYGTHYYEAQYPGSRGYSWPSIFDRPAYSEYEPYVAKPIQRYQPFTSEKRTTYQAPQWSPDASGMSEPYPGSDNRFTETAPETGYYPEAFQSAPAFRAQDPGQANWSQPSGQWERPGGSGVSPAATQQSYDLHQQQGGVYPPDGGWVDQGYGNFTPSSAASTSPYPENRPQSRPVFQSYLPGVTPVVAEEKPATPETPEMTRSKESQLHTGTQYPQETSQNGFYSDNHPSPNAEVWRPSKE